MQSGCWLKRWLDWSTGATLPRSSSGSSPERAAEMWNGLDPDVWGELAQFAITGPVPTELDTALDYLGKALDLLTDLASGDAVPAERIAFLHDDIVSAAVRYGWWADQDDTDWPAEGYEGG